MVVHRCLPPPTGRLHRLGSHRRGASSSARSIGFDLTWVKPSKPRKLKYLVIQFQDSPPHPSHALPLLLQTSLWNPEENPDQYLTKMP
ncbi:hypothetical protein NL676_018750 [Syzygium grande]|nr:hypothetical protein NL676_018750 [Syzygium grande]